MSIAPSALRIRGRATELAVLGEVLDQVASGRPSVVLVDGEAGIGKTRLLQEMLRVASGRGMQVVSGKAGELEQTRPFGLVATVFDCRRSSPDARRVAIAELLAVGGAGDRDPITVTSDPGLRFRAVDAFADLAEDLALTGPLVIGADDLQWADPSSLLTLGALSRRLTYLPAAVIGCLRPAPRLAELDQLLATVDVAGARRLTLHGLTETAVAELVAEALAAQPGPVLLAEIGGAAGNPLFVTELLDALVDEGMITRSGERAELTAAALPPTLRLTILRRLSFLSEDTLQVLRAAAILGSAFTLSDLVTVTDQSALQLSGRLAEAVTARVIDEDGAQLRFRHDLIRDAIYEDQPLSFRRALHEEAGRRLAAAGAPALQVAEHLGRAARPGDATAIDWLTKAARQAAVASPTVAASLLQRAIELMSPANAARDRLLVERANNVMAAGRVAEALEMCRRLLDRVHSPEVDGPARVCIAHALLARGQVPKALAELEHAISSPSLAKAERPAALAWTGFARVSLGDLDGAAAAADEARATATESGDHQTVSIAMATLAVIAEYRGQLDDALQIIDEATRLADHSPRREGHRYPIHIARGHILIELDRLEDARSTLRAGMRLSEELGIRWPLASYAVYRALTCFFAGEWDDAISEIEAGLELAEETGETYSSLHAHSLRGLISLHRNDLTRATADVSAAVGMLEQAGARFRAQLGLWARALVLEASGDVSDAFATLAECWDHCTRLGLTLEHRMLGPDLVRLARVVGDHGRARYVAAAVAELATANPEVRCLVAAARRCQGLAEDDADLLYTAASIYASGPRPLEHALTCEDAGTAFVRQGMVEQARSLLDQAIEIYEHLDAVRNIARAEAALRRAGIHRGRKGRRGRPQSGWPSLTQTERSIATLVAEGLSNPQIGNRLYISRRTVQTHLGHVFAKLDLSTRSQLAAEVSQHRGQL